MLTLISSQKATRLGLTGVESPVFVSPYVRERKQCQDCDEYYTPLTYQAGLVTKAQHFHSDNGGIYYYVERNKSDVAFSLIDVVVDAPHISVGFVARLVPDNQSSLENGYEGRSSSARVIDIDPYCINHLNKGPLAEGLIFKYSETLYPMCLGDEGVPGSQPLYSFIVREGKILFSQEEI